MITTVAHSLFDRLIEEFPADRSYARADLSRSPMPEPVSDYLVHLMRERLDRAVPKTVGPESWIDPSDDHVRAALAAYREALIQRQRIPASDWPDALQAACRETVRYLVRPAAALTDAVFDGTSSSVGPETVFSRLDFFTAYPYFREVIEAYFDQKEVARIDRGRFEGLVNRIDRQMTADYTPSEWRKLLQPLIVVLGAAGVDGEVPVDLLKAFLAEKGADDHLSRLKQAYGLEGVVPVKELPRIFQGEPEKTSTRPRIAERETGGGSDGAPAARPAHHGAVPLWKQFEQGRSQTSEDVPVDISTGASGTSVPLWKQFRTTSQPEETRTPTPERSALADLERAVLGERGARNRDLFVQHLFSGDRRSYEETLRTLQTARSWSEASQIIAREIFLKHQVNIYSDPAVAFTDAVEAQYRS